MTCQYHSEIHISNPLKIKQKNASGILSAGVMLLFYIISYLTSHSTEQDHMTDETNAVTYLSKEKNTLLPTTNSS